MDTLSAIAIILDIALEENITEFNINFDPEEDCITEVIVKVLNPRAHNDKLIDFPNTVDEAVMEDCNGLKSITHWDNARKQYVIRLYERKEDQ